MRVDYLAHHTHLIPEVTNLVFRQWAELFEAGGTSRNDLRDLFVARAQTQALPLAVVALEGTTLAGTGSIKLLEPGTKPGVSPWLAGMYVKEEFRGAGVGAMLVRALESKAAQLGVETLYLSVGDALAFYERLGWSVLERVTSYGVKEVTVMSKRLLPVPRGAGADDSSKRMPLRGAA